MSVQDNPGIVTDIGDGPRGRETPGVPRERERRTFRDNSGRVTLHGLPGTLWF